MLTENQKAVQILSARNKVCEPCLIVADAYLTVFISVHIQVAPSMVYGL